MRSQAEGTACPDSPELIAYAKKERPLLIGDSLVAFARCDENSAAEMRTHLNHYRRLTAAGATCIILHHASDKSESAATYRGSSDIPAAVDTAYTLTRDDGTCAGDELGRMLLDPYKTRISPGRMVRFEHTERGFESVDAPPRDCFELLAEYLTGHPGAPQKELIDTATTSASIARPRFLKVRTEGAGRDAAAGQRRPGRYYLADAKPIRITS